MQRNVINNKQHAQKCNKKYHNEQECDKIVIIMHRIAIK